MFSSNGGRIGKFHRQAKHWDEHWTIVSHKLADPEGDQTIKMRMRIVTVIASIQAVTATVVVGDVQLVNVVRADVGVVVGHCPVMVMRDKDMHLRCQQAKEHE